MSNILVNCNAVKTPDGAFVPVGLLSAQAYVDGTSASAQSSVLDASNARLVRIKCYAIAALGGNTLGYVQVGTNPTASATSCIPLCFAGDTWEGVLDANNKIAAYNCKIIINLI